MGAGWIQFSGPIFQNGAVTSLNFKGQLALQGTNAPEVLYRSNPASREVTAGNIRMLNSDISKLMPQVRTGDDVIIK